MYSYSPYVQANGRRNFDKEAYKKYDQSGKDFAKSLLEWLSNDQREILELFFGKFKDCSFEIVETKKYGDIYGFLDKRLELCEVESRPKHHFEGNFYEKNNYKTGIHVPQKPDIKKSNGIYLILNGDDAINFPDTNCLPDSFIIIKTEDIVKCDLVPPQTKNGKVDPKNDDWKYLVPHHKVTKFATDGKKYFRY